MKPKITLDEYETALYWGYPKEYLIETFDVVFPETKPIGSDQPEYIYLTVINGGKSCK